AQQPVDDRERDRDRQGEDQPADDPVPERLAEGWLPVLSGVRWRSLCGGDALAWLSCGISIHRWHSGWRLVGPAYGRPRGSTRTSKLAWRGPRGNSAEDPDPSWPARAPGMGARLACGAAGG